MATKGGQFATLTDHAKRLDPNGKISVITNILAETNEMLTDAIYKEGNLPTGEQTTIATGLPTSYYVANGEGTPHSKATTAQITENAARLVARSQVAVETANLNGNANEYRMSESKLFIEGMNQRQCETMIYGTGGNPKEYVGFANRYGDLSAKNAQNILNAGGTGSDNTSIYLVAWGARSVHCVFPKGSKAGIQHDNIGIDDALDENGNPFRAYKDEYSWKNGLVVKDWRYAVRIANIDVSDLEDQTGTQDPTVKTAIIKQMSRAIDRLPTQKDVKPCFYVNRTVASLLRIAALDKASNALAIQPALNQFGDTIQELTFLSFPVRLVDQILNTEETVA